jgi:hypothetical protein
MYLRVSRDQLGQPGISHEFGSVGERLFERGKVRALLFHASFETVPDSFPYDHSVGGDRLVPIKFVSDDQGSGIRIEVAESTNEVVFSLLPRRRLVAFGCGQHEVQYALPESVTQFLRPSRGVFDEVVTGTGGDCLLVETVSRQSLGNPKRMGDIYRQPIRLS